MFLQAQQRPLPAAENVQVISYQAAASLQADRLRVVLAAYEAAAMAGEPAPDSEQMRFVRNDSSLNMTDQSFVGAADALLDFPPGPLMVRVWVNGVQVQRSPRYCAAIGFFQ